MRMMFCRELRDGIENWIRDYDRLQYLAVLLLYIQIGCSLIGSLGALYNGVLLVNLGIALFALVAIESSSQSLGRTYAVLLFCAILLDISWFLLFARRIWDISPPNNYGLKLTLAMQSVAFCVRFSSSLLWIQIYRLGVSYTAPPQPDYDLRNSFLSPVAPPQHSDLPLGGSIYDPAYFSSLFEDGRNNTYFPANQNSSILDNGSTSSAEASQLKLSMNRSFQTINEEKDTGEVETV